MSFFKMGHINHGHESSGSFDETGMCIEDAGLPHDRIPTSRKKSNLTTKLIIGTLIVSNVSVLLLKHHKLSRNPGLFRTGMHQPYV